MNYDDLVQEVQSAQPPVDTTPYDAAAIQLAEQERAQASLALSASINQNADEAARNRDIAKRYNIPATVVDTFPEEFRQRAATEIAQETLAQSPMLQRQITDNPAVAPVIHDDVQNAAMIEKTVRRSKVDDLLNALPDYSRGLARTANTALKDVVVMPTAGLLKLVDNAFGTSLADRVFKYGVDPLEQMNRNIALPPEAGFIGKASDMVGALLGMVMEAEVTAGPKLATEGISQATTLWPTLSRVIQHGTAAMATPALTGAIEAGQRVYEETNDGVAAWNAAKAVYVSNTLMGMVPMSAPGGIASRAVGGFAAGISSGEIARLYTNRNMPESMQTVPDFEEAMLQGLMGAGFGVMGPRGNLGMVGRVRQTYTDAARAEAAAVDHQRLDILGQLAEASKWRERDPGGFHKFVEDATEDGRLENVYVDAQIFRQELDKAGVTQEKLAEAMPEVAKQMNEALSSDGMVRIPVGDYAVHLAGEQLGSVLLPHLRTDPEGMTYKEQENFYKETTQRLTEQARTISEERKVSQEWRDSADRTHEKILQGIRENTMLPSHIADVNARVMATAVEHLASRLRITPEEAHAKYGAAFAGDLAGRKDTFTQPDVNRDLQINRLQEKYNYTREKAIKDYVKGKRIDEKGKESALLHQEGRDEKYDIFPRKSIDLPVDDAKLTELRRAAAKLEKPEKGITFTIDKNGRAIATGPARIKVPDRFQKFADKYGLVLSVRRRGVFTAAGYETSSDGVKRNVPTLGSTAEKPMPIGYRESGALYFGEMGEHLDRTGKMFFQGTELVPFGESAPTFFSPLARTFAATQQKKGTPEQWQGIIKNFTQKGIKQAQIDATGVNDWLELLKTAADYYQIVNPDGVVTPHTMDLASDISELAPGATRVLVQPSKTVTKEQVLDHINRNDVVVGTRIQGGPRVPGDEKPKEVPTRTTTGEIDPDYPLSSEYTNTHDEEFDFDFGHFETEEPDEYYLSERADERLAGMDEDEIRTLVTDELDRSNEEEMAQADALVEYIRDNNTFDRGRPAGTERIMQKILDDFLEQEREWYYSSGDEPASRTITVNANGEEYTYVHSESYGDHELWSNAAGESVDLLGRRPDDPAIMSAIYLHLAEGMNVDTFDEYRYDELRAEDEANLAARREEEDVAAEWEATQGQLTLPLPAAPEQPAPPRPVRQFIAPKWGTSMYTIKGGRDYQERLLINHTHKGEDFYYTTHYDAKNIVAYTRSDTRDVPIESIKTSHPDLYAKLKAEGKTHAKVYLIQEAQSDWGQQGGEKPMETVHYEPQDLYINEKDSQGDEETLKNTEVVSGGNIRSTVHLPDTIDAAGMYFIVEKEGGDHNTPVIVGSQHGYDTKEDAENFRLRWANANQWYVNAPDQVYRLNKSDYPTREEAIAYVIENKTKEVKSKMTNFQVTAKRLELDKQLTEVNKKIRELELNEHQPDALIAAVEKANEISREMGNLPTGSEHVRKGTFIPLGEMVGKTDLWVSLLVKDVIRDAAEQGHDLVVWLSADQQVSRYGDALKEAVDLIEWEKKDNGLYHIVAYKSGIPKINQEYSETALKATLGDHMAKTVIEGENSGSLSGSEISISTNAMATFYGDAHGNDLKGNPAIVPKVVNDVLKKVYGSDQKVQMFDLVGGITAEKNWLNKNISQQPGFVMTPEVVTKARESVPLFQESRGFYSPEHRLIGVLKNADLSTFIHETGHYLVDTYAKVATAPDAPKEIVDDVNKLLAYAGVKDLETWNRMDIEQQRPHHETIARAFETYFMEGKAPSVELQPTFERIKAWMIHVYQNLTALNASLTDEVRQVFDRMLASEEQIHEAESIREYWKLFKEKPEDVSPGTWHDYEQLGAAATQAAIADMQQRSINDMRWLSGAKDRALREMQKLANTERAKIRGEVTKVVDEMPVYRAARWMRTGEMTSNGEEIKLSPEARKAARMNTDGIRAMYPETGLSNPQLERLRPYVGPYGIHPDLIAEMFGLKSGDELVRSIIEMQPRTEVIKGFTDRRMLEEHGELATDAGVQAAAEDAIHNDVRARFMATGLKILTKSPIPARQLEKGAHMAAEVAIAEKKVGEINPRLYMAAEAKANKEAIKLAPKKPEEAVRAQRSALLNNQLTKVALETKTEISKMVKSIKRFDKKAYRAKLDPSYLEQLDMLRSKVDFKDQGYQSAYIGQGSETRAAFRDFVLSKLKQGEIPYLSESLLSKAELKRYRDSIAARDVEGDLVVQDEEQQLILLADGIERSETRPYKDMTVGELRAFNDTLVSLETIAKNSQKILTAKGQQQYQVIRDEIAGGIIANARKEGLTERTRSDAVGKVKQGLSAFGSSLIKVATWARIMDGGKDNGPVWKYLIRPANNASAFETTRKARATEALSSILNPILKEVSYYDKIGKGKMFPSLNTALNWNERFSILLNVGNESNMQRLLGGGIAEKTSKGLTVDQLMPVLESFSAKELQAAQAVWDHLETYRPEIGALEKELVGVEPEWIVARPFTIRSRDGETVPLRGGYYPVKFDPRLNMRAGQHAEATEAKELMKAAYSAVTTRRGFVKNRVEEVQGRPLLLDMQTLYSGVDDVIHDLAWRKWVIDANKLMRSKTIDAAIREHYGADVKHEFDKWKSDNVIGPRKLNDQIEKASAFVRKGVSMSGLAFNVLNAAIQPIGLAQSIVRLGGGVEGTRWVGHGIKEYLAAPVGATRRAMDEHPFMANRTRTRFRELNEIRNKVQGESKFKEFTHTYSFWLMMKTQQMVDTITYLGAKEKALVENPMDEQLARDLAVQAVKDSQGGGEVMDQAGIERTNAIGKLFTVFYAFQNTSVNMGYLSLNTPGSKGKFAVDMLLLFAVQSVLVDELKNALTPGDSGYGDAFVKNAIKSGVTFALGLAPFVRETTPAAMKAFGEGGPMADYRGPAGLRLFGDLSNMAQQAQQREFDAAFRKSFVNLTGDFFGLPAAQINRTITGVEALQEGETKNPAAVVFGYREKP